MNKKEKTLLHYIVPSAEALCVTYLYNIVDGILRYKNRIIEI